MKRLRQSSRANPVGHMNRGPSYQEKPLEKTSRELDEQHRAWADMQPTVQLCAFCPGYRFEGTAAAGRVDFQQHLAAVHPERKRRKRKAAPAVFTLQGRGVHKDAAERAEAMVGVRKRRRQLGVDESEAA